MTIVKVGGDFVKGLFNMHVCRNEISIGRKYSTMDDLEIFKEVQTSHCNQNLKLRRQVLNKKMISISFKAQHIV